MSVYNIKCIWPKYWRQLQHKGLKQKLLGRLTLAALNDSIPLKYNPLSNPSCASPATSQVRQTTPLCAPNALNWKMCWHQLGRHCWLLPALSVRQRVLLLTCDEGGAPHRAAMAVSEPTHRGWWWIWGAAEAMVGLGLCSERRGWAPHHHSNGKLVSNAL